MKKLLKIASVFLFVAPTAWADNMLSLPKGGVYIVKENNIVTIGGQTMVTDENTKLLNCGGTRVNKLPSRIKVTYTLKEPLEGPIPVLATVSEVCS